MRHPWKSTAVLATALVWAAMPSAGQQVTSVEMTFYGADRATYGSWAPTPADLFVELVPSVEATGGDILGSVRLQTDPEEMSRSKGSASVDFRLAPDETPAKLRERVEAHLRQQGFHLVSEEPDLETRRAHPRIVCLTWDTDEPGAQTSLDLPPRARRCGAVVLPVH
ncbi:MAG TPA: hypothetical protein VEL74_14885 [Thermoanaerobaculia bacterium]|nr:hypothetical protein [Thermoanaerobaculia bacterium]